MQISNYIAYLYKTKPVEASVIQSVYHKLLSWFLVHTEVSLNPAQLGCWGAWVLGCSDPGILGCLDAGVLGYWVLGYLNAGVLVCLDDGVLGC